MRQQLHSTASGPPDLGAAAIGLAADGFRVHPERGRSKIPALEDWPSKATTDLDTVAGWWSNGHKGANIGIATGRGLLVLDIDGEAGMASLVALEGELGSLPLTREALTAHHGRHLYFTVQGHFGNPVSKLGAGLDIRADGGQVVAPPSVLPDGEYRWANHAPIAPLPDAWWDRLLTLDTDVRGGRLEPGELIAEGERNDRLFRLGCSMRDKGLSESAILAALTETNREACRPPLPDRELSAIAGSAARYEPGESGGQIRHAWRTEPPAGCPPNLPDTFWSAHPVLEHVRQAAHSRTASADAVLHAVLARTAAMMPYQIKLPAIVAAPSPLCYFAGILGPANTGKSSAARIAGELLRPDETLIEAQPGSGEGLAEILLGSHEETGEDGKKITVRKLVSHNVLIFADEGGVIATLTARQGNTLLPTLRSIWAGAAFGALNASAERRRIIPAGQYSFGAIVCLQTEKVGPLFGDAGFGTPQRFAWASCLDPSIPDARPEWPGELDWRPPLMTEHHLIHGNGERLVTVARAVQAEIAERALAVARGRMADTDRDGHGTLVRLRTAALLGCLLYGRPDVTDDLWQLAGNVRETSDGVRDFAHQVVAAAEAKVEDSNARRHASQAVRAVQATEAWRTVEAAKRITALVRREPEIGVHAARIHLRHWRAEFDEGLSHAVANGWIAETSERQDSGQVKRVLTLGPAAPRTAAKRTSR